MAASAAVASVLCTVAAVLLHRGNVGTVGVERFWVGDAIVGTAYPLVGAWLVRRRPTDPVGWVLVACAAVGVYALGGQWHVRSVLVLGGPQPLAGLAGWVNVWMWFPHLLLPTLLPLLFPDGRVPSRRWRGVLWLVGAGAVVVVLGAMLAPVPLDAASGLSNPWAVLPPGVGRGLMAAGLVACFGVAAPLAVASVVVRLRRARGEERIQLLWLLTGGVLLLGSLAATGPLPERLEDLAWSFGLLAALAAVTVAIVRSRSADFEVVLSHTLVTVILIGLVVAVYVAGLVVLDRLRLADRTATVVVGLASLLAVAAYDRVQRLVDRMLLGDASDPYAVVLRVGGRLDRAEGPTDALQGLVEELHAALRLPWVLLRPAAPDLPVLSAGDRGEDAAAAVVPVLVQGQPVGALELGPVRGNRPLDPAQRSLVEDAARRAAALLQAATLLDELQRSREAIVAGREEERRRLRHDLHDGVGPRLAGMALQLDSLADRLQHDPDLHARAMRLRELMRDTVQDLRGVVDDLRPPALDELGLVGALREHLGAFDPDHAAPDHGVRVEVVQVGALGELPAAVEVAAHRIAVEAATNAVRHADASSVTVRLRVDDTDLHVEVDDDGTGLAADAVPGVGMGSMRDRAQELGGSLAVAAGRHGGTTVRAALPLRRPATLPVLERTGAPA